MGPVDQTLGMTQQINVQVYRSPAARQIEHIELALVEGSTAWDAVQASGWADALGVCEQVVAVWGRRVSPDHVLRTGDRVEILRPLQVDPKESRRLRYHAQARPRKQPR
ncbi:RnfH family protein [Leptothrix ochracea]|uniref:RnfH family protein n=1 Tax=Leptothrix ochracea TaxID=735331 RepID=UPI0034E1E7B1